MKAKTLMGMIACASACAVSVNVLATDLPWFDGKVSETTASAISTPSNATWNATLPNGVMLGAGVINLDNDSESALVISPSAVEPLSDGVVTISATAVLTPSAVSDLVAIDNAKAGFAIGNDGENKAYYGYASGEGSSGEWIKLAGAALPATDETPTTFKIVLDYRTGKKNVKFFVGETQLYQTVENSSNKTAFSIAEGATGLSDVAAYGSGSITALAASCEKKVAEYNDIGYGSIAEAVIDAGESKNSIKVVGDNGTASSGAAANGLQKWECAALNIAEDAEIEVTPAAASKKIANKITLAANITPAENITVKFAVGAGNEEPTGEFNADAIGIDKASGEYTIKPIITATAN